MMPSEPDDDEPAVVLERPASTTDPKKKPILKRKLPADWKVKREGVGGRPKLLDKAAKSVANDKTQKSVASIFKKVVKKTSSSTSTSLQVGTEKTETNDQAVSENGSGDVVDLTDRQDENDQAHPVESIVSSTDDELEVSVLPSRSQSLSIPKPSKTTRAILSPQLDCQDPEISLDELNSGPSQTTPKHDSADTVICLDELDKESASSPKLRRQQSGSTNLTKSYVDGSDHSQASISPEKSRKEKPPERPKPINSEFAHTQKPDINNNGQSLNLCEFESAEREIKQKTYPVKTGCVTQETPFDKFEWLTYGKQGFVCKICSVFYDNPTEFSIKSGPNQGKLQDSYNLSRHPVHKKHLAAVQMLKEKRAPLQKETANNSEIDLADRAIIKKLQMVYFAAQKKLPLTTFYKALHEFVVEEIKDDTLVKHKASRHSSYGQYVSSYSLWELIGAFAEVFKGDKLEAIRSARAFSVLFDESEDAGHREQMSVFIRIITQEGEIKVMFGDLIHVLDRTANGIMTLLLLWFSANGVNVKRCFFCGMDTCNVMSGEKGGVQKLFKMQNAHCIYCGCNNHTTALIFTHLSRLYPIVKDFVALINYFYLYYKKATQKREFRQEIFKTAGVKCPAPAKAVPTRWLSVQPQN